MTDLGGGLQRQRARDEGRLGFTRESLRPRQQGPEAGEVPPSIVVPRPPYTEGEIRDRRCQLQEMKVQDASRRDAFRDDRRIASRVSQLHALIRHHASRLVVPSDGDRHTAAREKPRTRWFGNGAVDAGTQHRRDAHMIAFGPVEDVNVLEQRGR